MLIPFYGVSAGNLKITLRATFTRVVTCVRSRVYRQGGNIRDVTSSSHLRVRALNVACSGTVRTLTNAKVTIRYIKCVLAYDYTMRSLCEDTGPYSNYIVCIFSCTFLSPSSNRVEDEPSSGVAVRNPAEIALDEDDGDDDSGGSDAESERRRTEGAAGKRPLPKGITGGWLTVWPFVVLCRAFSLWRLMTALAIILDHARELLVFSFG